MKTAPEFLRTVSKSLVGRTVTLLPHLSYCYGADQVHPRMHEIVDTRLQNGVYTYTLSNGLACVTADEMKLVDC